MPSAAVSGAPNPACPPHAPQRRGHSAGPATEDHESTSQALEDRTHLEVIDLRHVLIRANGLREEAAKHHPDPAKDVCPETIPDGSLCSLCSHKLNLWKSVDEILAALLWDKIKKLPDDDDDVLLAKEHLAAAYFQLREYPLAEEFYREVLAKRLASKTTPRAKLAQARRNLATCLGEGLEYARPAMTTDKNRTTKDLLLVGLELIMLNVDTASGSTADTSTSADDVESALYFCRELEAFGYGAQTFARLLAKRISDLAKDEEANAGDLFPLRIDLMRVYMERLHRRKNGEAVRSAILSALRKSPIKDAEAKKLSADVQKLWKRHEKALSDWCKKKWKALLAKIKKQVQQEILPERRRAREKIWTKWSDISTRLLNRRQRWRLVLTHATKVARERIQDRRNAIHDKWHGLVEMVLARRHKSHMTWMKAFVFVRALCRWKMMGVRYRLRIKAAQKLRALLLTRSKARTIRLPPPGAMSDLFTTQVSSPSTAEVPSIAVTYDAQQATGNDKQLRESAEWIQGFVDFRKSILGVGFDAKNVPRVRVTIIDSGLDDTHPFIQRQGWQRTRRTPKGNTVPLFKDFTTSDPAKQHIPVDENGHGTFIAGIILQLAPDVELSVARISVDEESAARGTGVEKQLEAAIKHAVDTWDAEIISMSFGMTNRRPRGIKTALGDAYIRKNVVMLGAAGNFGNNDDVAFPASSEYVFKVFSATAKNNGADVNPPAATNRARCFAILGCDVRSIWPAKLKAKALNAHLRLTSAPKAFASTTPPAHATEDDSEELWTTMSGTSFATPIVASLVAILYQFYNVKGNFIKLNKDSLGFKTPQAMEAILLAMSRPSAKGDPHNYLHPQGGRNNAFRYDPTVDRDKARWFAKRLEHEIAAARV